MLDSMKPRVRFNWDVSSNVSRASASLDIRLEVSAIISGEIFAVPTETDRSVSVDSDRDTCAASVFPNRVLRDRLVWPEKDLTDNEKNIMPQFFEIVGTHFA